LTRCARAAVNARGYKDTNLYGLQIALEHLFIEPGELDKAITKQIRDAKDVKDAVYSGRRSSPYESKQMLMWAQKFAKFVFGRLALPGFDGEQIPIDIPEPAPPPPRDVTSIDDGQQAMGVGEPPRRSEWRPRSDLGPRQDRPHHDPNRQPDFNRGPEPSRRPDWTRSPSQGGTRDSARTPGWRRPDPQRPRWLPPPDEGDEDKAESK
jgi:hypothetical protein